MFQDKARHDAKNSRKLKIERTPHVWKEIINGAETKSNLFPFRCLPKRNIQKRV